MKKIKIKLENQKGITSWMAHGILKRNKYSLSFQFQEYQMPAKKILDDCEL